MVYRSFITYFLKAPIECLAYLLGALREESHGCKDDLSIARSSCKPLGSLHLGDSMVPCSLSLVFLAIFGFSLASSRRSNLALMILVHIPSATMIRK